MNKYMTGGLIAIALVLILGFGYMTVEESNDGPLENAAETVKDAVDG